MKSDRDHAEPDTTVDSIERAHLREGATTLAGVAAQLGYADEPHFIRDFSRATGVTPGRFAAAQRG